MQPSLIRSSLKMRALLAVLFLSLVAPVCLAADPALRAELDKTYLRILENPQDRELTLQYAAIAMQLEDYEAAIPPLERILLSEPENAKIKLQIGVLYRALGSKLMAKQYFTDAAATKGAASEIVSEAKGYLRDL